ncbi:MAG: hypothetical protein NVSMB2_25430 [Chloroflexota bacterium]
MQLARETTPGVPLPATRVLYVDPAAVLTRVRKPNPHMFMTTTRDNVRALTVGPVEAAGTLKLPVSADEIIEPLLLAIKGGVTPTTPGGTVLGRQWVFSPSSATLPDAGTIEWNDGMRAWQGTGMYVNTWDIAGSVLGQNEISIGLFGQNIAPLAAITPALVQRTPSFFEGWETALYIDAFGGTPGTTVIPGQLISWSVKFGNNLTRKYTASNTLAASAVPIGALTVTGDLVFEAASGTVMNEYYAWENGSASPTKRLVRLVFGNNTVIDTATTAVGTTTAITQAGNVATYTVANTLVVGNAVNVTGATPAGYNVVNGIVTRAAAGSFDVNLGVSGLASATVQGVVTGGAATKTKLMFDLPGSWTTIDLSKTDAGTRTYSMAYQYVYDPTNAYGIQVTAVNARTAAY